MHSEGKIEPDGEVAAIFFHNDTYAFWECPADCNSKAADCFHEKQSSIGFLINVIACKDLQFFEFSWEHSSSQEEPTQ